MSQDKLLLHACCAPCASAVVEKLLLQYQLTLLFFNPNLHPEAEYHQRLADFAKLQKKFEFQLIEGRYIPQEWDQYVAGYEKEPEGGKRCELCFRLRLSETAKVAKAQGYDLFATTLTISSHKNYQLINDIGQDIASSSGVAYLDSNFKKQNGFLRSIEISQELGLYRQNYCGCRYSKNA